MGSKFSSARGELVAFPEWLWKRFQELVELETSGSDEALEVAMSEEPVEMFGRRWISTWRCQD